MSTNELIAHALFSSLSGLSISITGFGCDVAIRELYAVVSSSKPANGALSYVGAAPTAINSALCAALITALQATLQRRLMNRSLLLNTLPLTLMGVVLSLNTFSDSVRAVLVPSFGACLLGLALTVLWIEFAEHRRKVHPARESGDDGRQDVLSWRLTGVLGTASFAAGIVSGWCPPPGPALMAVLLVRGRSGALVGAGEWRATAALITFSACILRMGLLLLENGASVGPMPEISVLLVGGFVGLGCGNLCLRCVFYSGRNNSNNGSSISTEDAVQRRTPPAAVFHSSVVALALISSIAMITGGAPAIMTFLVHPLALIALALTCVVGLAGCVCGCRAGAGREYEDARGAYGEVALDNNDLEVELAPFTAGANDLERDTPAGDDEYRDGYLDEEDGYLADEGETESRRNRSGGGGGRGGVRGVETRGGGRVVGDQRGLLLPDNTHEQASAGGQKARIVEAERKDGGDRGARKEPAPSAQSLFPQGHTMEL